MSVLDMKDVAEMENILDSMEDADNDANHQN